MPDRERSTASKTGSTGPVALLGAALLLTCLAFPAPAGAQEPTTDSATTAERAGGSTREGTAEEAAASGSDETPDENPDTSPAVRTLEAPRIQGEPPAIDGRIDDAAWRDGALATDFVQLQPDEGQPASQPTEARVLYGGDALYVAFRAHDSAPDSVAGQLTRRDQDSYSDWLHVLVDSYFDRRTAFNFAVNPAGVKKDAYMFDDTDEDISWDAVWEVATRIDDDGWTAEFRIPYSQLRFEDAPVQTWGFNLGREIARYDELSTWSPLSQREDALVSRFGLLRDLRDLGSPNRLEVEPYLMTGVERSPGDADDPFHEPTAGSASIGADATYGLTGNLTLNLTVNPDFGQVEADPSQVNLTAFETFLPEKRPFFLEGQDIFRFGLGVGDGVQESLFYSRRIGRAPQGRAEADGGWVDAPGNATILGASKLSGKTASGWSVGALHAVTGQEEARVETGDGVRRTDPVEPRTHYSVGRLQKDFRDGRSALGLIGTATHRDGRVADDLGLRRGAYTGGIDGRHRFGSGGDYQLRANVLGSVVTGSEDALTATQRSSARYFQRPDATHTELDSTRTALGGWAGTLEVGKWGGGYWRAASFLQARSPGFEANDLGFQTEADFWATGGFLGYHVSDPGDHLRRWSVNVNAYTRRTFGNERAELGGNVNGGVTFHNLWNAHGGVARDFEAYSPTLLRGGPAIRTESSWRGWGGVSTDSREALQLGLNGEWGVTPGSDSRRYRLSGRVRWRPSSRMTLRLDPFVRRSSNDRQWIENLETDGAGTGGTHHLFGRLEQTTTGLTTRLEMAFTPDLSLQLYAQPFVSAGSYGDFKEVADPRAESYGERFRTLAVVEDGEEYEVDLDGNGSLETFDDPDFDVLQFRSNLVLRWEFLPGSTLYAVWSQDRDRPGTEGDFALRDDVGDLFSAPASNVLMLKVSYWLSP